MAVEFPPHPGPITFIVRFPDLFVCRSECFNNGQFARITSCMTFSQAMASRLIRDHAQQHGMIQPRLVASRKVSDTWSIVACPSVSGKCEDDATGIFFGSGTEGA